MFEEGDVIKEGPLVGFEVISTYSRAQAIEDDVLIDVSETAREAGIVFPVAVTRAVWDKYITPDERSRGYGQSESGRLWDVVWMLRCAIRRSCSESTILFSVYFIMKEKQKRLVQLKAVCGPGDNGESVITIILPDKD